jgi:hypothetical protein
MHLAAGLCLLFPSSEFLKVVTHDNFEEIYCILYLKGNERGRKQGMVHGTALLFTTGKNGYVSVLTKLFYCIFYKLFQFRTRINIKKLQIILDDVEQDFGFNIP